MIAKANAGNSTPETNVTNNTRSMKIVIGPDLFLSSLSAPATGGAGLPVDVTDTTKNQGTGSAAASGTAFYLSANAVLGARRRSARQPPGRSPPAEQLEHDQDHADDPGRDAGR